MADHQFFFFSSVSSQHGSQWPGCSTAFCFNLLVLQPELEQVNKAWEGLIMHQLLIAHLHAAAGIVCKKHYLCVGIILQGETPGERILILCNAIGSPVDSKVIELEPKCVLLTGV